ncbi:MAG TPA: elongation factor Ts, partial [Thiomicrospira sp.]|nr:elongation factor Ts [Thiomicrospira sp.]
DKKAGRVAAEGVIAIAVSDDKKSGIIAEVNCETDFVAKGDEFKAFANEIAALALAEDTTDNETIMGLTMASGETVDTVRREMIARIGENMTLRFAKKIESEGVVGQYQHGEKIGVVVAITGGDEALARDVAMHIAAVNPAAISEADVDPEMVAKERAFQIEQAQESGKPMEIIEKMIEGRMRKYLSEITLLGQSFVKNPDLTVEKLLKESGATVTAFIRLEVGAGIEVETLDFAAEVALAGKAVTG